MQLLIFNSIDTIVFPVINPEYLSASILVKTKSEISTEICFEFSKFTINPLVS